MFLFCSLGVRCEPAFYPDSVPNAWVSAMTSPQTVHVDLGSRSYQIAIGENVLSRTADITNPWFKNKAGEILKCLIVTDPNVLQPHANTIRERLTKAGATVKVVCIKAGEGSKCLKETSDLYDELVDFQADRQTIVIAVGGGVVGDLSGFVAATYARGLRFLQVPTTLLAMVDSSVGGKTGINHPSGKNLIGAFHQPVGVLIDTDVLKTLPDREYRSGMAEVVKYGVILDEHFFEYLERHSKDINDRNPEVVAHVVRRSCELKAQVVREDERETSGVRAILNYGHTYAHAFEALAGYGKLLHGEAVAMGMICGSRLALALGRISEDDMHRQKQLLTQLHLPTFVPEELLSQKDKVIDRMLLDKKTVSGDLKFVLPDRIGHVETIGSIKQKLVLQCLDE